MIPWFRIGAIGLACLILWKAYDHYTDLTDSVATLTVERDAQAERADKNEKAFRKAEADRLVAVATLEFLQAGLIENEKQARIAAEETASISESDDAPAAAFWEKTRKRLMVGDAK